MLWAAYRDQWTPYQTVHWFIAYCLTLLFQSYCCDQCTYPCFPRVLHTSTLVKPHSSVGSVADWRTGGRWFKSLARPIFFPRIDDSHCDRIHSSFTTVRCFDNGYVGKKLVAWKEYCEEYRFKDLQESMDRCTDRRDITERLLKTALNTVQSINRISTPNSNLHNNLSKPPDDFPHKQQRTETAEEWILSEWPILDQSSKRIFAELGIEPATTYPVGYQVRYGASRTVHGFISIGKKTFDDKGKKLWQLSCPLFLKE